MKPILEIKNISKKYNLFHEKVPYLSLRDSLSNLFNSKNKSSTEEFYALKDVSFTVNAGESIGIIGKNGAGKSTLLKILSKITPPTSGSIISRGRIASLLEVGTGFHPELSGRENVFMNGSILGMRQHEIKKNFDAIVDFAGVEKFIDTPLKHYSSGMQLRLAFAVAAFLENEILIIDEVLAVGDAEFQKKCMGKMGEVSKDGRTVLFVSHNMGSLVQICKKGILLMSGELIYKNDINAATNYYLNSQIDNQGLYQNKGHNSLENVIEELKILSLKLELKSKIYHNEGFLLAIGLFVPKFNSNLEFAISLYDKFKNRVFTIHERLDQFKIVEGKIFFKINFPPEFITPGSYSFVSCIVHQGINFQGVIDDVCHFEIVDNGSKFSSYPVGTYGNIFANYKILN